MIDEQQRACMNTAHGINNKRGKLIVQKEDKMKKILKKVMAITGALLMGATILAGVPGYTAKADAPPVVTRPNRVVYEGDILKAPSMVCYIKSGMSEIFYEAVMGEDENEEAAMECLLHMHQADEDNIKDYSVPALEQGSNGWIITILMTATPDTEHPQYIYLLEPYTASAETGTSDNADHAAPVYVYVEPAWLSAWKGLLADTDKQIVDAKAGDTVILELGEYYNISNARMQQIAEKNDVTFVLNMTYDKVSYRLTIEPGTEIDLSCDWYGPLKLLSMFPYEVVE